MGDKGGALRGVVG